MVVIRRKMGVVPLQKGASPTKVINIQPIPGVVGKKRIEALRKAVRNRNARMRRETKKIFGEYTPEYAQKLIQKQYLPGAIRVDFSKIKTLKEYNALMRMLELDKTKAWKTKRDFESRNWLKSAVENSLNIEPKDDPALFERIDKMTSTEVLMFALQNSKLIGDLFDYYGVIGQDVDERNKRWRDTREALGLTREIPNENIFVVGGVGA